VLDAGCRAITDGAGHTVPLDPRKVCSEIPTIGTESEGEKPRDTDEVFEFATRRNGRAI
jgi:hypothetical protein